MIQTLSLTWRVYGVKNGSWFIIATAFFLLHSVLTVLKKSRLVEIERRHRKLQALNNTSVMSNMFYL